MTLKTGKTAPKYNLRSVKSAIALALAFNDLPDPPDNSEDWVKAVLAQAPSQPSYDPAYPLGMALNATYGCCVISDIDHQGMLWTANTGTMVSMTDAQIEAAYAILCPGFDPNATPDADGNNPTDQGCNEQDACDYLIKTGALAGSASIDPANYVHQKWAIQLYGSIKYGIQLPDYAEDYYSQGKVWDVIAGKPMRFVGGHDVCGLKYVKDGTTWLMDVGTWGREQLATPAFLAACVDECHCPLSNAWDRQATTGLAPSGYDDAVLLAALAQAIKI